MMTHLHKVTDDRPLYSSTSDKEGSYVYNYIKFFYSVLAHNPIIFIRVLTKRICCQSLYIYIYLYKQVRTMCMETEGWRISLGI